RLVGDDILLTGNFDAEHCVVRADPGEMEQVVMNLVVNAADALPKGGQIRIGLAVEDVEAGVPNTYCSDSSQSGRHLLLSVHDTGKGTDSATLPHIFEPFFTTKEAGQGTGLGLSTVYGIVKRAGGCISAQSRPGEGSTFHVLLPLADPATVAPGPSGAPAVADLGGSERILVVEDDPVFRELICEVLRSGGYELRECGGPDEVSRVLEQLEEDGLELDLLISDVVMPGMPGTELAQVLAERFPAMKTLLMSGYHHHDLEQRGAWTDSAICIRKPFGVHELRRRVRDMLDTPPPSPAPPRSEEGG
ncbi:MAG: ATP-binding protein, partial [Holophagales bacterium]|nr:ATP-binding protein [Holophagales bacterium]